MNKQRSVHVIACGVLSMDIEAAAGRLDMSVTTDYLPGGLHERPNELRRRIQDAIDEASAGEQPDLIVLGYGLCGRGTVGVTARSVPLAIPRVHDCIALFLGSDTAYRREFARCPGTYYISGGWYVGKVEPKSQQDAQGLAGKPRSNRDLSELSAKYGRENARAIRHFLDSLKRNYSRAAFIDTGAPGREKYAHYARAMAEEFGWRYEELPGDLSLLIKALTATESTDEIAFIPPGCTTVYDAVGDGLKAAEPHKASEPRPQEPAGPPTAAGDQRDRHAPVRLGLGIDAGGTYTDAVVYSFADEAVRAKAKALTTRWDFTIGIDEALDALPAESLSDIGVVAVSTTLATNAIVEGQGQKVGLLVMPPYGLFDPADIPHSPTEVIGGQLEITGAVREEIDPEAVRQAAARMVDQRGVGAFAVSGFASTINPAHELEVKRILREQTNLSVTCGHELSEMLNFRTRAITAVLNARIIPRLERFVREAAAALRRRGIDAPILVVKGDGSLMSASAAREKPVETILSGPAASVAGARYLTGRRDALVVDIGGTTTDTAALRDGSVATCDSGTRVGGTQTHVRALDMRTVGLGGDSVIAWDEGELTIGPLRVAPLAWAAATQPGLVEAIDYVEMHLDDFTGDSRGMDVLAATGYRSDAPLDKRQTAVRNALAKRPHTVAELARITGAGHHSLLALAALEHEHLVQRCALTPTDLLCIQGKVDLWDASASARACQLVARLAGMSTEALMALVGEKITRDLATELLKKQLDSRLDPAGMVECPVCQALLDSALGPGDGGGLRASITLEHPVIGIGAPAGLLLPEPAGRLNAELIIPPDADVANAIGAVTSHVVVSRTVHIRPGELGQYVVQGLPGARRFDRIEEAQAYAREELKKAARQAGRAAGSAETRVDIESRDRIGSAVDGTEIFLERILTARLVGRPDVSLGAPAGD